MKNFKIKISLSYALFLLIIISSCKKYNEQRETNTTKVTDMNYGKT